MYNLPLYIKEPVGNNLFGASSVGWNNLYVASIIKGGFNDLGAGKEIVFKEYDKNGNIITYKGLANFIETYWNNIPVYIFDNHNHAFYFWYKAYIEGVIKNKSTLVHIDEHSDMRDVNEELKINNNLLLSILQSKNGENMQKISDAESLLRQIFDYTNNILNVGNYIKPAIKSGLIGNVMQVTGEVELDNLLSKLKENSEIILNLDLDFFSPGMDYINYNKKKAIIREVAKKSKLITIATSPFFIDQKRAIEVCKDIFCD